LSSSYHDGVFVRQLNKVEGSIQWIQQVGGSSGTTTTTVTLLAQGGDLAVNTEGNAILYGTTNGSLFCLTDDDDNNQDLLSSDIFAMTF
jgi:hypothetical protein